ncbi:activator of 90 kDa heat shock protein ATPase homolog 1 isoform X2 [Patella vulgata]|uniref:activator of 90 kDa heat shock protein ATPase homolog 1 isoform X2 n=1 Tax=Patella vulgata TaxID=6465 RepID=UPI0024A88732|nr:activator of 90 kDa heat shock protein ATPase homolog 1 isoform X2 [Patella vulgata]
MAKWGEGDPRWIVEERPDATNVNNWHWVEKNASTWSKDKLKELLVGLKVKDGTGECEIKELSKIEGEASANNRKAKLIFFYEWEISGKWSGFIDETETTYKGEFEIPNLSEENDPDEIEIRVTCDNTSDEAYKVKEIMRRTGTPIIQAQIAKYIKDLREEYSQGIVLPTKTLGGTTKITDNNIGTENIAKKEMNKIIHKKADSKDTGTKIRTKTLKSKEEFKCRASDLYRALTDPGMVSAFTGATAIVEAEKGGKFSLNGGNISGEFIELIPNKKLVKKWRVKSWPDEHYSTVTIELTEKEDCTDLHIQQVGIPDADYDRTVQGWQNHFWERIKQAFGFGVRLF